MERKKVNCLHLQIVQSYIEKIIKTIPKFLVLINEFNKITRYIVQIKPIAFLNIKKSKNNAIFNSINNFLAKM